MKKLYIVEFYEQEDRISSDYFVGLDEATGGDIVVQAYEALGENLCLNDIEDIVAVYPIPSEVILEVAEQYENN